MAAEPTPDGIYVRVPLFEATLQEAVDLVEDSTFWTDTRMLILFHFPQVGLEDYWSLTVGDHREMFDFLVANGLADGDA